MQEVNLALFFKLWKKMPDYIINQSSDENRVVDAVRVGQAQRYGKFIELKTPWTHQDHAIA